MEMQSVQKLDGQGALAGIKASWYSPNPVDNYRGAFKLLLG